jgi:hypothetical protein
MTEGRKAAKIDLSEQVIGLDEDLKEYASVREKVLARLQKMGFEPAPMPRRKGKSLLPEMPENPSEISNKEITDKRGEIISIYSYAIEMRAIARVTAEAYEEAAKHVRDEVFKQSKGIAEERKAKSRTNIDYKKLNLKRLEWGGVADFLEARCDTLDKCDRVLSRDVEFRTREWDQYRREENVGRMKRKREQALGGKDTFSGDDDS